jgi:hypothetical protein
LWKLTESVTVLYNAKNRLARHLFCAGAFPWQALFRDRRFSVTNTRQNFNW